MSIPDALRATVLLRFRRLDRRERTILMRVAVIGRHFEFRVAVAAAGCSAETVRAALERADTLQLLVASGVDRYSFRHALTHDIVYAEFLNARLRPPHRRIAQVLERALRSGDAALEELAYHAWAAGDARRAVRYNELAGDRAAAIHAHDDARRYYVRARSLIEIGSPAYLRLSQKLDSI